MGSGVGSGEEGWVVAGVEMDWNRVTVRILGQEMGEEAGIVRVLENLDVCSLERDAVSYSP